MASLKERAAALFEELRRRRVFRTGAVYLVVAWAIVEASATVLPLLYVSESVVRVITVVAVFGFPVTLVAAWLYDVTPSGIRRSPAPDSPFHQHPRARLVLMGLTVMATGLAGAAAWALWLGPRGAPDGPELDPARVAVLYFDDHSEGGRLGYLADGFTEALIHELAQISALKVVSRNGVKPYRKVNIPFDSIARALQAGSLVEGSLEGDRERLVATVQLIDGRTGDHTLSQRIERSGGDLLALRDDIVRESAILLGRTLGRELAVARSREEADSPEAWDDVQEARALIDHADTLRWALGEVDGARRILQQADSVLREAEEIDPDWAEPTLLRAEVARRQVSSAQQIGTPEGALMAREAIDHVNRVLEREPEHAGALALRGHLRIDLSWHPGDDDPGSMLAAAESDLRRAIRLDPDDARAWIGLAEVLRIRGDFAEASVAAERALQADPFLIHGEQSILYTLAHVWLELQDFDRARRWNAEGRRRYPAHPQFHAERLTIMASAPDAAVNVDTAWALVEAVEDGYGVPMWPFGYLQVASVLARAGQEDSARAVVGRIRDLVGASPWTDYYEAHTRLMLGEPDRAIDLLADFLADMPERTPYIAREWWWQPLQDSARFQTLVAED